MIDYLVENKNSLFDPQVVDTFLEQRIPGRMDGSAPAGKVPGAFR